jgi:hypothetical protein
MDEFYIVLADGTRFYNGQIGRSDNTHIIAWIPENSATIVGVYANFTKPEKLKRIEFWNHEVLLAIYEGYVELEMLTLDMTRLQYVIRLTGISTHYDENPEQPEDNTEQSPDD